jgi:hypothetical protein
MAYAYDFSVVPGPSPSLIKANGGEGVLVYSGNARQSDAYLDACRAAGLKVVWIWEVNTDSIFGGYDYAVVQCRWHESRVQPGELTYVACDTRNQGDVTPFLKGWSDTTREPVFGIYGPDFAIRQAQAAGTKCQRWWGVVNWIVGGGPDNAPANIDFWSRQGAHLIQLIGSPIGNTDQNLIMRPDWGSLDGGSAPASAQEGDNVIYQIGSDYFRNEGILVKLAAEEAAAFYPQILAGKVTVVKLGDNPLIAVAWNNRYVAARKQVGLPA